MTQSSSEDSNLREELKAFDERFRAIKVKEDTGPVPDGRWQGNIQSAQLKRSESKTIMIEWVIVVTTEGAQAGKTVRVRWVINDKTLKWIKSALHLLGLKIQDISPVADHLPQLVGASVDFTIRTKDQRRNIYFNRRLDQKETEDQATVMDDDFPV